MKKDDKKTREEKLLEAIGNLPEAMIANAAEYSPHQKKEEQGKLTEEGKELLGFEGNELKKAKRKNNTGRWGVLYKGLAVAACLMLVVVGGSKCGEWFRKYLDGTSSISVESGSVYQSASGSLDDSESSRDAACADKSEEVDTEKNRQEQDTVVEGSMEKAMVSQAVNMALWVSVDESRGEAKKEGAQNDDIRNKEKADLQKMKEGKSLCLQIEEMKDSTGEIISAIKIQLGEDSSNVIYSLRSQTGNCRIMSIKRDNSTRFVEMTTADCKPGDMIALDTSQRAWADWSYDIVPKWSRKGISIIDIIDFSMKVEADNGKAMGRLVVGKKGERYYGVYQNKND